MHRFAPVVCLLVSVLGAVAQAAPQSLPAAASLIQKSLTQLTGNVPVNDVTLMGIARRIAGSDDESGGVIAKALLSGDARIDFNFPSGQSNETRTSSPSGETGTWAGTDGAKHAVAAHNLFADEAAWFFPAVTLEHLVQSPGFVASYVGSQTRYGKPVEHLSGSRQLPASHLGGAVAMLAATAAQMEIYLDASTLLPSAISFKTHPDNDLKTNLAVEVRFSGYSNINGAQVPLRVQKFVNGGLEPLSPSRLAGQQSAGVQRQQSQHSGGQRVCSLRRTLRANWKWRNLVYWGEQRHDLAAV